MKRLLITSVFAITVLTGAHVAFGQEKIKCRVMTIEGSNEGTGVDDRLSEYASLFSKPPFDAFNSFRLVHQKKYELELNTPQKLQLPGKLNGTLEFTGRENKKLELDLELVRTVGKTVQIKGKAFSGTPFVAAGLKSPVGRWIIAVECTD